MTSRRGLATPSGGPQFAIVPPLVHVYGAKKCYQHIPGDGGAVPDLTGIARQYTPCPWCANHSTPLKELAQWQQRGPEPIEDKMEAPQENKDEALHGGQPVNMPLPPRRRG